MMSISLDLPLSFSGELCFREGSQDLKVFLVLDTKSCVFRHFSSRQSYMNDDSPVYQFEISELLSIEISSDCLAFTVKSFLFNLTYFSEFTEITTEWYKKLYLSLEYYHITFVNSKVETITVRSSDGSDFTTNEELFLSEESFEIISELGSGGFGKVFKVTKKDNNQVYALKRLNKNRLRAKGVIKYAWQECIILESISNPFIIGLEKSFQTQDYIFMMLEYCLYGDFQPVLDHYKRLDEAVAKFYISETILAFEYLHSRDIVYRDLKPSNLLIDSAGHIKLSDFGLAKGNVTAENPASSFCGTLAFMPPEILNNSGAYPATDIYLLGANLYVFLTGTPPFYDKISNFQDFSKAVSKAKLVFPKWVREEARDLIAKMMTRNPKKRPDIKKVKEHRFFADVNWEDVLEKRVSPPISKEVLASIVNCDKDVDI